MPRIFISYGITKSASTFAWQLIKHVAIAGGLPIATLTAKSKNGNSPEDYIDPVSEDNLALVKAEVGDRPVVIKTHGHVTPAVARLVADGTAQVFVSFRDPRDVALSLLDHGARSRRQGINDFAEFHEPIDTLETIRHQTQRFENWVKLCNPLLIPYDEICFNTKTTIMRIAGRLGVSVDAELISTEFHTSKHRIGQFNKGEGRRFEREMSAELSALFLAELSDYYRQYLPGELARFEADARLREGAGSPGPRRRTSQPGEIGLPRGRLSHGRLLGGPRAAARSQRTSNVLQPVCRKVCCRRP